MMDGRASTGIYDDPKEVHRMRVRLGVIAGRLADLIARLGPGMGRSLPGWTAIKVGGLDVVRYLASKPRYGVVLITGTNGKTTTTRLTCSLLSRVAKTSCNYDSNTVNALTTALLRAKDADIVVAEYGIRNKRFGIPDTVCRLVNPTAITYTTISKEHYKENLDAEDPFEAYFDAKRSLARPLKGGALVLNADDPRVAYIREEKKGDPVDYTWYGLEVENIEDPTPPTDDPDCPVCGSPLGYERRYFNHKGVYGCPSCGFSRPDPDVKVVRLSGGPDEWNLLIEYNVKNVVTGENLEGEVKFHLPLPGLHNVYNSVAAVATFLTVTPETEGHERVVRDVMEDIDPTAFIPPGRFEILDVNGKPVGVGQGDNGDAFKANANLMLEEAGGVVTAVYATPDEGEDPIFRMHRRILEALKPEKVHVFPGRESVEAAERYAEDLSEDFDVEFHPIPHERMSEKVREMAEVCRREQGPVFASGCGPEHDMWDALKRELRGGG